MNGCDLLNDFRQSSSEQAFAEVVRRFTSLVYSVAKRQVQDPFLAEDVAQAVFTRLAKAPPELPNDGALVAWLHRTTIHVAIDAWRTETRRRAREQKAAVMETGGGDESKQWEEIAPHLDEAINQLADADRQAVLLRFFEQRSMREVGGVLQVSEDAAKVRVGRALERLRAVLAAKGVTCSSGALGSVIGSRAVESASISLITKLSALGLLARGTAPTPGAFWSLGRFLFMSNTKIVVPVVVFGALGLGIAIHKATRTGPPPAHSQVATGGTAGFRGGQERIARDLSARADAIAQANAAAALENLKNQLRAMLQTPREARGYPPPELRELLGRFGGQVMEAVPILLEGLDVPDYVTRCWAVAGLKVIIDEYRESDRRELSRQAFAQARPVLARILQSDTEPGLLRLMVVGMFVPNITRDTHGIPLTRAELYPGAEEDLIAALQARDRQQFGGTIVDLLSQYFAVHPDAVAPFWRALHPMLDAPNKPQRGLAAYALASWPGEKPPEVKRELLRELQERSDRSYRAARGLGKLGPEAADTVSALLAYAEATKSWRAVYGSSALEAACRLQPELRAKYPEIDRKLKEEESLFKGPPPRPQTLGEWVASLPQNEREQEEALVRRLNDRFDGETPVEAKEAFITSLQAELARAPETQRAALTKAIELVRAMPAALEPRSRTISAGNLTLDARVLLVQVENPNSERIFELLRRVDEERMRTDPRATITAENFTQLANALREIDPGFESEWRKSVLLSYPELDRILPREER